MLGGGGSHDVDIIIGGYLIIGYLMMMLDYKGGREVKNLEKSDYVMCECSLSGACFIMMESILCIALSASLFLNYFLFVIFYVTLCILSQSNDFA